MPGRQHKRYKKRIEIEVRAEGKEFRMFSSDISESGLFIRTNKGLPPGTALDLKLYLPDGAVAFARGLVKRTTKTKVSAFKNGMGVRLIEADESLQRFFESEFREPFTATPVNRIIPSSFAPPEENVSQGEPEPLRTSVPPSPDPHHEDFVIVRCAGCNVKNRVLRTKIPLRPRCGKCGLVLQF